MSGEFPPYTLVTVAWYRPGEVNRPRGRVIPHEPRKGYVRVEWARGLRRRGGHHWEPVRYLHKDVP